MEATLTSGPIAVAMIRVACRLDGLATRGATTAAKILTAITHSEATAQAARRNVDSLSRQVLQRADPGRTAGIIGRAPESRMPVTTRDRPADAVAAQRTSEQKTTCGDPVDVATGDVILTETDLILPAVLPLRLTRTYLSSYRAGRSFGREWASTLDQRVEAGPGHLRLIGEDGSALPFPGNAVLDPTSRKLLYRTQDGGFCCEEPGTGMRWHFRRPPGVDLPDGVYPLIAIADRNDNRVEITWGPTGAVAAVAHSAGYRVAVTTDSNGRVVGFAVQDSETRCVLREFGYDDAGRLSRISNPAGATRAFEYSGSGLLSAWIDATGYTYRFAYDRSGRCIAQGGDDGSLAAIFAYVRGRDGGRITTFTDSLGAATSYRIDDRLQVTAVTDAVGAVTTTAFDNVRRPVLRTDPLGRTTQMRYTPYGDIAVVIRADGRARQFDYERPGLVSRIHEFDGQIWSFGYDEAGNLIRATDPSGATARYRWRSGGRLAAIVDPCGATTIIDTNPSGLPVTVVAPGGAVTRYRYDMLGRIIEITDPAGAVTGIEWAPCGKPARRIFSDGTSECWHYDLNGSVVRYCGPAGNSVTFDYGPFGCVIGRTEPDGAATRFAYDTALRLTSITNPQNLVWGYSYDAVGRTISETDYDGRILTYAYDPAGQLVSRCNGADEETTYGYDRLGNLITRNGAGESLSYSYDQLNRLVGATNADAVVEFIRDVCGRVIEERSNGRSVSSTYDAAGRRRSCTGPSGVQIRWDFDYAGRVSGTTVDGRRFTSVRDTAGRETCRRFGSGLAVHQRFSAIGQLVTQTVRRESAPSEWNSGNPVAAERILLEREYSYRPDRTIGSVDDSRIGNRRYEFDPNGRITTVTGPGGVESYIYDTIGNLTAATIQVAVGYEYTGTLMTRAGRSRYRYDAQNRLECRIDGGLEHAVWHYEWDVDDRLRSVLTPDGHRWNYSYDAFGRRIAKTELAPDGRTVLSHTTFVWDGDFLIEQTENDRETIGWIYEPYTFTPTVQYHRMHRADGGIDRHRFYVIVTDIAGAPVHLVDVDSEQLAGSAHLDLWGGGFWAGIGTNLRFPGQYHDPETGLHYNRYRYYAPYAARYISTDPLGLGPAPNPTTYPHNPLAQSDPLGLDPSYVDLYHGTDRKNAENIRKIGVQPDYPSYHRDFGPGFYTTRMFNQSEEWASWYDEPIILHFRVAQRDLDGLRFKIFTAESRDLEAFVRKYRAGAATDTPYDMVEGPLLMNPKPYLQGAPPKWHGNQVTFFNDTGPLLDSALQ